MADGKYVQGLAGLEAKALPATLPCKTLKLMANPMDGMPQEEHFKIEESTVSTELEDGHILVQVLCLSADPYLRGQIKSAPTDAPMHVFLSGKVLKSSSPDWVAGDLFGANGPASTVQVIKLKGGMPPWKLTEHVTEEHISYGIGVLGMPGSTAYGGLIDVLKPAEKPDAPEVVFVSAASGAVGQIVGQLAKKVYGCKVIGSAGGEEKGKLLIEKFGFDHSIDYKTVQTKEEMVSKLKEVAPDGIDMYFENVGGIHFDAAFACLRKFGRVACCGVISNYNKEAGDVSALNSVNLGQTIYQCQRIEGFVCTPWLSGQRGKFLEDVSRWVKDGTLTMEETFFDGIENWVPAFQSLFTGANKGKVVVRV